MSGGALDYVYACQTEDLKYKIEQLEAAAEYLAKGGYVDIVNDVKKYIFAIKEAREAEEKLEEPKKQLYGVLRSIEWAMSGDTGEEAVKCACEEYGRDKITREKQQMKQQMIPPPTKKVYHRFVEVHTEKGENIAVRVDCIYRVRENRMLLRDPGSLETNVGQSVSCKESYKEIMEKIKIASR
jgi:hypothetical protein